MCRYYEFALEGLAGQFAFKQIIQNSNSLKSFSWSFFFSLLFKVSLQVLGARLI